MQEHVRASAKLYLTPAVYPRPHEAVAVVAEMAVAAEEDAMAEAAAVGEMRAPAAETLLMASTCATSGTISVTTSSQMKKCAPMFSKCATTSTLALMGVVVAAVEAVAGDDMDTTVAVAADTTRMMITTSDALSKLNLNVITTAMPMAMTEQWFPTPGTITITITRAKRCAPRRDAEAVPVHVLAEVRIITETHPITRTDNEK